MPYDNLLSIKTLILCAFGQVWNHRWNLIAYEALVAAASLFVFAPSVSWVLNRFAAASGRVALTNEQIASFALSFWGVLTVVVIGMILLVASIVGRIGIIAIGVLSTTDRNVTAIDAAWLAIRSLGDLASLSLRLLLRYLLAVLPAAVILGLIYRIFLSGGDINYYLAMRPPAFWLAVGLATPVVLMDSLVLVCLYTRWMYAVPICMLERRRPAEAIALSAQRIKPVMRRLLVVHVGWLAIFFVVNVALATIMGWLAPLPLALFSGSVQMLLLAGVLVVLVTLAMASAMTFIGFNVFHMITVICYLQDEHGDAIRSTQQNDFRTGRLAWIGRPSWRVAGIVAVIVGVLLGLSVGRALINQIQLNENVQITAHRAAAGYAPENTLAALEIAIAQNADWAEIDVQETSDGIVVVLHDKDLRRLAGDSRAIYDMTWEQVQAIDIGSWYDPKFTDQRIVTLEQFIEAAKGQIKLNIELKDNGHAVALPERVAQIIRNTDFVDQCIITSLNYNMLLETREHLPEVKLGMVIGVGAGNITAYNVDAFSLSLNQLSIDLVYQFHALDRQVLAWTLNNRIQIHHALDIGVDNLITDYPDLAREVLDERAEMPTTQRLLLAIRSRLAQ